MEPYKILNKHLWQCGDVSTSRRRLQGALVARSCYPLVFSLKQQKYQNFPSKKAVRTWLRKPPELTGGCRCWSIEASANGARCSAFQPRSHAGALPYLE